MKKIVILGTGGASVDIFDTIADMVDNGAELKCVGFLDDNKKLWDKEIKGSKSWDCLIRLPVWTVSIL